jgi:hypothetical protein
MGRDRTSLVVAGGAGFAGDRVEPAVALAASGMVDAVALECLAERTLVPGLRARRLDPAAGFDPRLERRLMPLLPAARRTGCRIITNLGAANPAAAARQIARLASRLGLHGLRVAAVIGDDVAASAHAVKWREPIDGGLLGAHAYLGAEPMAAAVRLGADVVVTGRVADSALFSAPVLDILVGSADALAGATAVGHLLECSGQITGGNFEAPGGDALDAAALADLGFPLARIFSDGSAEIGLLDGAPGRVDRLTTTVQLLYEVHDPAAYVTPDVTIDFTGLRIEEIGRNKVRVSGARARGRPETLKVSGFVDRPGVIADIEIGFAGRGALERARRGADVLERRLRRGLLGNAEMRVDVVGLNSMLGAASQPPPPDLPEARVHVSARCPDAELAQVVEDEVYALTLSGPAGGGGVRSERRANLAVIDGLIHRSAVPTSLVWEVAQ